MTNCLTQAKLWVKKSSVSLITAATDGYFTLWDLTDTMESFYDISFSTLKAKQSFENSSIIPKDIACENRYHVHSNSIKAMDLVPLSDDDALVVTAGDDSSIAVSVLRTRLTTSNLGQIGVNATVATISIPDAHAASVTALRILRRGNDDGAGAETLVSRLTLVSSGNDHRVKLWSIALDRSKHLTEAISVEFLLDRYSAVADIASLSFLSDPTPEDDSDSRELKLQGKLLVGGAGMEMFETRVR